MIITIKQLFRSEKEKSNKIINKLKKEFNRFRRKKININDLNFIQELPGKLNIKKKVEHAVITLLYLLLDYHFFEYLCFSICSKFRKKFTLNSVIYMHLFFFPQNQFILLISELIIQLHETYVII